MVLVRIVILAVATIANLQVAGMPPEPQDKLEKKKLAKIRFEVSDSKKAVDGATVLIQQEGGFHDTADTNPLGMAQFSDVPRKSTKITVTASGYEPYHDDLDLKLELKDDVVVKVVLTKQ
jgi:hypothetical protein